MRFSCSAALRAKATGLVSVALLPAGLVLLGAASALLLGCESAGERELRRCEALERTRDLNGAYQACMAASKADDGKYGAAARAKLVSIRSELRSGRSKQAQRAGVQYGKTYALASRVEETRRKLEKAEEQIAEMKGQISSSPSADKPKLEKQLAELEAQHNALLELEDTQAHDLKVNGRRP